MKEWALYYAELGLAVFPLAYRNKVPAIEGGCKAATTEKSKIERWWNQNPRYNIGIATGNKSNGLVVIDLDVDKNKGIDGYEVLRDWQNKHGELPETWQSITGRGGYHYFYKDTITHSNKVGLYEGVDIRGEGGYIVAPPSVHPNGNTYEWEQEPKEYEIAQVDDIVNDFFKGEKQRIDSEHKTNFKVPELIPEGKRVDTIVRLIASLRTKGLDDDAIKAAVRVENEKRCNPPLKEKELEKAVFPALKRDWQVNSPYYNNFNAMNENDNKYVNEVLKKLNELNAVERFPMNDRGRDTVSARFLHENEFQFKPKFKLILNSNYLPVISDKTVFSSNRVKVVPFERHFTEKEQNKHLKEQLQQEIDGILNWCIQGLSLYRKEGLEPPTAVQIATHEYSEDSDKIGKFISECLEKSDENLAAKDVYEKYSQWCNDCGLGVDGRTSFYEELKTKNLLSKTGTVQEDYAAGLEKTSKNTNQAAKNTKKANKETEGYLSTLDEIQRYTSNKNDDSVADGNSIGDTGGYTAPTPAQMFKKVPVANSIKGIADKIKKLIKSEDWEGLGKYIASGINKGLKKVYEAISWKKVGPKITKFCDAFTRTFNSLVDNVDWKLLGRTVGAGINMIVNTLNLLITGIDWKLEK